MMIDREEFEVWRDHPVTAAYFARIEEEIMKTKDQWQQLAWRNGDLSDRTYASHRERVDTLDFMRNLEFEDLFEQEDK